MARSGCVTTHVEPTPPAICTATTKAGTRCKKQAVERGLCVFHSGRLDLSELGRRGGLARAKKPQPASRADRAERLTELMWWRFEPMLADEGTGDTAAMKAVTVALDRFEPLFRDEAGKQVRRALAAQLASVVADARRAAEEGNFERVLAEPDRLRLDGEEPVVYEYETDPARMLAQDFNRASGDDCRCLAFPKGMSPEADHPEGVLPGQ
jgi:hypothetical protein